MSLFPRCSRLLPDRQLAGMVAGQLFTLLAYIGIACALYLLIYQLQQSGRAALRHNAFRITAAMLLLVLIGQFVLQPILADLKLQALPLDVMNSVFAAQFKTWHAVSEHPLSDSKFARHRAGAPFKKQITFPTSISLPGHIDATATRG